MKNVFVIPLLLIAQYLFSQSPGDIAFVGFNADGDKDFAIVALVDILDTNPIYFMDGDLTVDGKKDGTGEGVLKWERTTTVSAGTVVVFTDVDAASRAVTIGALMESDTGFNISASGDAVFACIGDPTDTEVTTTWLAGVFNSDDGVGAITNFSSTGLIAGDTFVLIDDTASKDGGEYNGVRTGLNAAGYRALIADDVNWATETTDGEAVLPFNTTAFSGALLATVSHKLVETKVSVSNGNVEAVNAKVIAVYNVLGQQVINGNLADGIYFVQVKSGNKMDLLKVVAE